MMWGYYNDFGSNMMTGFGGIMMLIFWVAFIAFIIWIVREISGRRNDSSPTSKAMEILKERYAKGEISKEEFESKKKYLQS